MNNYEGMFIINPRLSDEEIGKVIEAIEEEIKKNGGTITAVQPLGKQLLAYPIKRSRDGNYQLVNFQGEGNLLEKISQKYRINEHILRSLILKKKDLPAATTEVQAV